MAELNNLGERIYRGIGVSPGVVRGRIVVLDGGQTERPTRRRVEPDGLPAELDRLQSALQAPTVWAADPDDSAGVMATIPCPMAP